MSKVLTISMACAAIILAACASLPSKLLGSNHSDYTKLDTRGYELPRSAKSWACVRDNRSGLIWEVKTNYSGARNKDKLYRWGGDRVSSVALEPIIKRSASHRKIKKSRWDGSGSRYSDWNNLLNTANQEWLCGFNDWRVPDLYELASLVRCRGGRYASLDEGCHGSYKRPTINSEYFPNTKGSDYWSASPHPDNPFAWEIDFYGGYDFYLTRRSSHRYVRLVRSG